MCAQSKTNDPHTHFAVVTGLSGSGKSTALKALEDLGYYAVDNLPVGLLPAFVKLPLNAEKQGVKVALGMDVRDPAFVDTFPGVFQQLCREGWWLDLYFLDASDQALLQRYSETRRKHPLANGREDERQVLKRERTLLAPVKEQASHVIDTSRHTVHDLRREIHSLFKELAPPAPFRVTVMSFGFKHGIPFEADLVMDVRFLKNPHFVTNLRPKTGLDPQVRDYVFEDTNTLQFVEQYLSLLEFLLPLYQAEGKARLNIAIGCTGGHHRSVAIAEWLGKHLKGPDRRVVLRHRDIEL